MIPEQDLTPSPETNLMTAVTKLQRLGEAFQAETGLPASLCMLCSRTEDGVTYTWFEPKPQVPHVTWLLFAEAMRKAAELPPDQRTTRTQQNLVAIIMALGCPREIADQAKLNLDLL